ncbi:voltage-gated potassium channel [Reichenbachiella agariperforans]|uniref:Voltage-gated potassium channel n=1 Tax=Reichenbachiella agariperforans TaxID=156994 RepID=A0A1M6J626_REIAG|nr:potassium channel protein [Reichenbachiella agariperforans]SHJ42160.1 voltage-gated potassium channel [Reichenbachiella agariperforans]
MLNSTERRKINRFIFAILIGIVVYFILITLLIRFEQDSSQSSITNYHQAVWYTVVTLTTVGYGDIYPNTIYGRVIGYIFVLLSVGIYGLLIGEITNLVSTIKQNKMLGYNGTVFENHVVIIGWSDFGQLVTEQLIGANKQVAIVTNQRTDIDLIHEKYEKKNVFTLYADFENFDALKKVNIEKSSVTFVNLNDDTEKLVFILNIKKIYDNIEFVVTLENANLKNTFINAGVTNAISPHEISSKILASYMFEPDVAAYTEDIMSFAHTPTDYDIKQFLVTYDNPYLNKKYQQAFDGIKLDFNGVLIGMVKRSGGKRLLIKNPQKEYKIELGDYLIIIVNGSSFELIQKAFNVQEGYFKET